MFAPPEWGLVFLCIWLYGYQRGPWGWEQLKGWEFLGKKKKKKRIEAKHWDKWEGEREVFWPLVAFTTRAQIIEGHGNRSDRWTMLPFSNPLWTGPSIMGGEINSIHQLFVSLGPLMPPDIARGGLINVCGLIRARLLDSEIKTLLFTVGTGIANSLAAMPWLWWRCLVKRERFAEGSKNNSMSLSLQSEESFSEDDSVQVPVSVWMKKLIHHWKNASRHDVNYLQAYYLNNELSICSTS